MTLTGELANYYSQLAFADLPKEVVEESKLNLIDSLGCILAGAQTEDVKKLTSYFLEKDEEYVASTIGSGKKISKYNAMIVNGSSAHAVEMDDVHKQAKAHAGAIVVPTLLTEAESCNPSGKQLLLSLVIGYEVMLRIGRGINATEHRKKGWHATSTCGTFGAAATISSLKNFSEQEYVNAFGLAGTQSSGLWAFSKNGANSKMFHAGMAAMNGYLAADLVKAGLEGADHILEAEDGGFFKATSSNYSFDKVTEKIGEEFLSIDMTRKPFSCCRSMHPAIEAALEIRSALTDLEDITAVKVHTYEVAKMQCGLIKTPKNTSDAKFSIPYGIAVALVDGQALLNQFTDRRIKDQELQTLANKVDVLVEDSFDSEYPINWGCRVEIETTEEKFTHTIKNAKGDPDNPLSKEEVYEKFRYLSKDILGDSKCDEIINFIEKIEEQNEVKNLIKLLNKDGVAI